VTEQDKPGVVFDCTVYVQAALSPRGPAFAALDLLERATFTLYISADVLAEVRDVLTRSKLRHKKRMTEERVNAFLTRLEAKATFILGDIPRHFTYPRDPDDEPYINLALAANAKYLVTRDNDLLDLMKDKGFRKQYPHLTILDPVAFLRQLPGR
jgi:putative PIN family toxin of toxin-antitoxin system